MNLNPIEKLLTDTTINEILVNDYDKIFYEKAGVLYRSNDHFPSEHAYLAVLDSLIQLSHKACNREKPFLEINLNQLRYTFIFSEIAAGKFLLSIRRPTQNILSLADLTKTCWCSPEQAEVLKSIIQKRKNILVVGGTASGKTTILQSLLTEIESEDRVIIIEDTEELKKPNAASVSLLSRSFVNDKIVEINLAELVKRALRLRPDRLVLGEARGAEAHALLLALSSGHRGSLCSLHADNAKQSILRLEMLVQLGAPQWDLRSIRRLIALSVDFILVVEKNKQGRKLKSLAEIKSVEETGLLLETWF